MKDRIRKTEDDSVIDTLSGIRFFRKEQRPMGRLPQLNKNAKKLRRLYNPPVDSAAS